MITPTQRQALDWILNQRHLKKKGQLSSYRIHKCERIPGWNWGNLVGGDLLKDHPLFKKVHPTLNTDVDFDRLSNGSMKKVWWICFKNKDHIFDMPVSAIVRYGENCCPYCSGKRVDKAKSFGSLYPNISSQWHPTKNGNKTPFNVLPNNRTPFHWICRKGHEWTTSTTNRIRNDKKHDIARCPYCMGKKVCVDNCLSTAYPKIAKEWHPTKNGKLTPDDVTPFSHKKIWWKCSKGHEYDMFLATRVGRTKTCPYCSNHRVDKTNCLATTNPKLAKEWHPTKNGKLTPYDVTEGSSRKVWWKGKCGHEWDAVIASRGKGKCPYCDGKRIDKSNCLATLRPDIAKRWHPTKNGKLTPYDVGRSIDLICWWTCGNGIKEHCFSNSINKMTNIKVVCPVCRGLRKNGT